MRLQTIVFLGVALLAGSVFAEDATKVKEKGEKQKKDKNV